MAYTLIANTGLQFITTTMSIKPRGFLSIPGGMPLTYTFREYINFLHGMKVEFDLCTHVDNPDCYVQCSDLREQNLYKKMPGGVPDLDKFGVLQIDPSVDLSIVNHIGSTDPSLIMINTFSNLYITKTKDDGSTISVTAFEFLLNKWLPMPMYELGVNKQSNNRPDGWCRVKIEALTERPNPQTGLQDFRLTWAFDTGLATDKGNAQYRPFFDTNDDPSKDYCLCNHADILLENFITLPGQGNSPVSAYLANILGPSPDGGHQYTYIGYYIYLINFLRLLDGAAPKITLYNDAKIQQIPVDMSIDIGNSRTCAVVVEDGDFTKTSMLRLTDMTEPWRTYNNAFDMRVVFRQATFGDSFLNCGDDTLFQYKSIVRVGEEAKRLMRCSYGNNNDTIHFSNYSSPKRFLWDDRKFEPNNNIGWEFIVLPEDSDRDARYHSAYIAGLSDYFDDEGHFLDPPQIRVDQNGAHYSRNSLMTFVMIELLQQANAYINSHSNRTRWGNPQNKRYLRHIIVTCPTAMTLKEQQVLRQSAADAANYLCKVFDGMSAIDVTPSPELCAPIVNPIKLAARGWLYDEALANQLVYLYSELNCKYSCNAASFFDLKGHERQNLPFNGKSLTIGTIDIGAGTTDVMVTAYGQNGGTVTPLPLYYDSFYTAGDDILHNLIQNIVLESENASGDMEQGSIFNSLKLRILKMSPDEMLKIERVQKDFANDVFNIRDNDSTNLRIRLASTLMNVYFGQSDPHMTDYDRRCRLDFNTQISLPIVLFFLEQLKDNRPARKYSYEDIFIDPKDPTKNQEPAEYLLNHFKANFGFDFKDLKWNFNPDEVGRLVQSVMEGLIKKFSAVMYTYRCDVLVLSGRPTGLKHLTDLLYKYIPVEPHRMVLLSNYKPGRWFPFNDGRGFYDEKQKAVVAVGALVGYYASTTGFSGLSLDFKLLGEKMTSTAKIIGEYQDVPPSIGNVYLTPANNNNTITFSFPHYIGCKQLASPNYPARPIFVIETSGGANSATIVLLRKDADHAPESIEIINAIDSNGRNIPPSQIKIRLQTLAKEGNFWMDNGVFTLHILGGVQYNNNLTNTVRNGNTGTH